MTSTHRFLLILAMVCAGCSMALIAFQAFGSAFYAAASGCVLYWASERLRIAALPEKD